MKITRKSKSQIKIEQPLISFIVPTYNRRNFLPICINSILSQTYKNIEIIVVNDAGEDVKDIVDSFHDNRIKYVSHETNGGLGKARNTGIENSKGQCLSFIDDDDQVYEFYAETLLRHLKNSNCKVIYGDCVRLVQKKDNQGNYQIIHRDIVYSFDYDPDMILFMNISPVTSFMVSRDCFNDIKFDTEVKVYEDWLMWLSLSRKYSFKHLAVPVCAYTFREDQTSMSSTRDFTSPLPTIYLKYYQYAKDQVRVCTIMNQILVERGLQPMFTINGAK